MWRATGRSDAGNAREAALEECQVVFGNPCVLLAVDQDVTTPPADGKWKAQDMPRARYAGEFDPEQIPGLRSENRNRREFVDYRAARGPKAVVYLPAGGRIVTIVEAESQHAAEERAFRGCHDEANGNKLKGNCLLYAVGNRVVLPLRLREPLAAPMLREVFSARLASADPTIDAKTRTDLAREYESKRLHKAEVASLDPAGTWYTSDRPTSENAEDSALESCQIYYGQPCILLAVDNVVEPMAGNGRWLHHNMPRVRYAGSYDPKQIPSALPATRERSDILAYGSASGPKAAALNLIGGPGSRLFIVTGATSQRAAEEQALKACNDDSIRGDIQHLCFLYAADNEVVLPRRLRTPLTGPVAVTASSENR